MRLPGSLLRDLFGSSGPDETQASLLDALGIERAPLEEEEGRREGDDDGVDDVDAALVAAAARVAALTPDDAPHLDRERAFLLEPLALGVRLEAGAVARLLECVARRRRRRRRRRKEGVDDDDSFGSLLERVAVEASRRLAPPASCPGAATEEAKSDDATEAASSLVSWVKEREGSSPVVSFGAKRWRTTSPSPLLLRGAAATEDVAPGEAIARIPLELLIHSGMVPSTEAGAALKALGLGDEETLLAFTLLDAADDESPREPVWRALKGGGRPSLRTALDATDEEISLIDAGAPARGVAERASAHARAAADAASPLLSSLSRAFGSRVRPELFEGVGSFSREAYLWALALWYSYAIEVSFDDGGDGEGSGDGGEKEGTKKTVPCLVPPLFLLNHSAYPHCVSYRIEEEEEPDSDSKEGERRRKGSLVARACRGAKRGEQLFLSYGRLLSKSSAHSLCYYGFVVPPESDPDAALEVDLSPSSEAEGPESSLPPGLETKHFLRATSIPPSALEAARAVARATANGSEGATSLSAEQVLKAAVASARSALAATAASAREALQSSSPFSSPFVRAVLDYGESGVALADRVMATLDGIERL